MNRMPRLVRLTALSVSTASVLATSSVAWAVDPDGDDGPAKPVTELVVRAKRLDAARANVDTSLGASTYTLTNEVVESRPGSESTSINQILLQVPGVQQDGSGQLHVRQSHGDLQYRINNVILPEGLSDLGESLSARIAQKVQLVTGALPAQYGFQAGGIVNVTTKNAAYQDGGQLEIYGGGHGEIEPSLEYGASVGSTNLFVSGSVHRNQAGLASPDGSARPNHDRSDQVDGFAFLDRVLDAQTRVSLILGLSDDRFQIPNQTGLNAATAPNPEATFQGPLSLDGVSSYRSELLDDQRREATRFGIVSLMHATDQTTVQAAVFVRESVLSERADGLGDLLFNGVARTAKEVDDAYGLQVEGVYELAAAHTLRAGFVASSNFGKTHEQSEVLRVDAQGLQTSSASISVLDHTKLRTNKESVFVQDEWRPIDDLMLNIGVRLDGVQGASSEAVFSPRLSAVWTLPTGGRFHAGYARYFLPAPREGGEAPTDFAGTTAATPTLRGDPLRSESDDYYGIGFEREFNGLTLGVDGYWREASNLISEGQFGPANLTKSFNYSKGHIRGVEFTATYAKGPFTAWSNLAIAQGRGKEIVSNQFYFTSATLGSLASRWTALDQDQALSGSGGASYRWKRLRVSGDVLYGSGLPRTPSGAAVNSAHLASFVQVNLAAVFKVATFGGRPLNFRLDILNALDARYKLRDGTGLGDGLPKWGPRRGVLIGLEQAF